MNADSASRDAFQAPLDADLLIEASAGTGKTYALTTLVARLIVEEGRGIDELLVVTFTVAAAGELRAGVRRALHAAGKAAAGAGARDRGDDQASQLRASWRRANVTDHEARGRLVRALRDIDRATITTIHGFCQQALNEFALPAGIPFSFEVNGDGALAVGDGVRDFWRRRMVGEPIALLEYAKARGFVPGEDTRAFLPGESTADWVARQHARPQEIRGVPGNLGDDPRSGSGRSGREPEAVERNAGNTAATASAPSKREEWLEALRAAERAWADGGRAEFLKVVHQHKWKKNKRPDQHIATLVPALDSRNAEDLAPDFAGRCGRERLTPLLFKNDPPPDDAPIFDLFELVGEKGEAYGQAWLAGQRRQLLEDVRKTLRHNAWVDRRLSFDALLVELHRALDGERGPELARRIRARYPIGLIDEFQDTDRLQAEIFRRIYAGDGNPANGRLFVVGDPKQSIYRFRGADVFAYLEAQDRLGASREPLRLEQNYRSTPGLIHAVCKLFSRPRPFVLPQFTFELSQPAHRKRAELKVEGERGSAPFQFVLIPKRPGEKRNKSDLTGLAARQAASEIARLIALGADGRAVLVSANGSKEEPLTGGDIAVLVRTGAQGKEVAEALRTLEIDSVELGTDNIFDSAEADALHRLLRALCLDGSEYNATPLLRGALAADLFDLDMHKLAGLRDDDDAWDHWRGRAREWTGVWQQQGIATLMRHILFGDEPDCSANLLRYPDGPRRLTNYLHLSDLLHEAETRSRPSRHGLVDWFRQSRSDSRPNDETAQLRLESDENLVKIVTVHRAKGLEFPIVFYPFAWDGRGPKSGGQREPTVNYYDDNAEPGTPVLDLSPSDAGYARERVEERADELRLLYVALTRAKYRTITTWAPDGGSEHAPMAWLLHGRDHALPDEPAEALADHAKYVKSLGPDEWLQEVGDFVARDPSALSAREIDVEAPEAPASPEPAKPAETEELAARELGRELKRIRQRTSYSALSTETSPREPVRDRDEVDLIEPVEATVPEGPDTDVSPEEAGPSIFSLPAGGRTGRCLHEVFERLLGSPEPPALEEACRDALAHYGFGQEWLPVARSLIANALDTPLIRPGEAGGVFRLSDLEAALAEVEFHLPLPALRRPDLGRCLKEHGYAHRLAEDDDAKIEGFLHGYIDLVACHEGRWYVIDYKSNRLGPDLPAYSAPALAETMREHGYHLQYLLYLTALHRLLRLRLPGYDYERHVGGAFYLFLRGMRPNAPGSGVFRDRPSRACIEALDACLGGGRDERANDGLSAP